MDAGGASGKSSLRNDKPATEAKRSDELDDKATTRFDDVNEINFLKSTQTQKRIQALALFLFLGSNNQNKGPPQRMIHLNVGFSRRSP